VVGARSNEQATASLESEFFRVLNSLVEPVAHAGLFSPDRWPVGVIVLETTGRHSGQLRSNPVMSMMIDGHAIVGTTRGERSDWFRNLEASPGIRYWLGGREQRATALVFRPDNEKPAIDDLPPLVRDAALGMQLAVDTMGCRFAVLAPHD
jgi:deazaflavin-dependent oxidoreductase (nitroreductase family)